MSSNPVDNHVGKRLRLRRTVLGMSQEDLAKSLGITFQQVQKYEKGVNRIGSSRLFDITKVLGVTANFFFDDYGDSNPVYGFAEESEEFKHEAATSTDVSNREIMSLVKSFCQIKSPATRKKAIELIKSLAEK
jgi:transcriptional regulator with XRE-family HTH domain